MFEVAIYTDGSCSNPGVGGYGAIIVYNGHEKEISGFTVDATTNNRMELTAAIEAIKALKKPCKITLYTDSNYVCLPKVHDIKWLTEESRTNRDLWLQLIEAKRNGKHTIRFVKVKGHSDNVYNNRCDSIAKAQLKKAKHGLLR